MAALSATLAALSATLVAALIALEAKLFNAPNPKGIFDRSQSGRLSRRNLETRICGDCGYDCSR